MHGARIVAVGSDASAFRLPSLGVVAVFDASGALDAGFNGRGILFDNARYFHSVAGRSDGYVVSGTERAAARVSLRAIARDGSPVRSFGQGGVAVHALPQDAFAGDLLVGDGGDVFLVRAAVAPGASLQSALAGVVHFLPNGDTDAAFGADGVYQTGDGWSYQYSHGRHLARHCDGRILFAAQASGASPPLRVHRITPQGRADTSFGSGVATLRGSGRTANDSVYVRVAAP